MSAPGAVLRNELAPPPRVMETSFEAMAGFAEDDHIEAWKVFLRSARVIAERQPVLRPALPADGGLLRLCQSAIAHPEVRSRAEARRLFETMFRPSRVEDPEAHERPGFLTGYYEPEVEGSAERSADFIAPILARPPGLGRIAPGVAEHPFLDRAAIEARIGTAGFTPVVWLRDWVEVFLVQVQGSACIRLGGGRSLRLIYDGRNGHPYTSIVRRLVERGHIGAPEMWLERLKAWLRQQGQEIGQPGWAVVQENHSYIFFRPEAATTHEGPIGGAGVPLSRLRSIAVDRSRWSYGLPVFIKADLPWRSATTEPFRRLTVAQDTGSAILGDARADLFFGSGEEAGRRAGDIRHPATFTVLLPRLPPEGG